MLNWHNRFEPTEERAEASYIKLSETHKVDLKLIPQLNRVAWSSNVIKAGIIDHSPSGILKLNRFSSSALC